MYFYIQYESKYILISAFIYLFIMILKESLMQGYIYLIKKSVENSNVVKYYYNLKSNVF